MQQLIPNKDNVMDNQENIIEVAALVGNIKVLDNTVVKWADHKAPPGEACLNCRHYGVYTTPDAPVKNPDGDPLYNQPLVLNGFCTEPLLEELFIVNVPSTGYCPKYEYREQNQFDDDALTDDLEGREV